MLYSLVQVLRGLGFLVFMLPFSAGSGTPWEGGLLLFAACSASCCSSWKEFREWLLMSSVLLVRQIPYRALSLGLKSVIRCWSRYACLRGC